MEKDNGGGGGGGLMERYLKEVNNKSGCRTVSNNGSGSGLVPAQNILAVQVWFGFT